MLADIENERFLSALDVESVGSGLRVSAVYEYFGSSATRTFCSRIIP